MLSLVDPKTCFVHLSWSRCKHSDGEGLKTHPVCRYAAPDTSVTLGTSGLSVSKIGVGTIAWGDPKKGYGTQFTKEDLRDAYRILVEGGVTHFDTAEVYGYPNHPNEGAEGLLGTFMSEMAGMYPQPSIGTKYFPVFWANVLGGLEGFRFGRKAIVNALRASLTRLGLATVDTYYIHFPFPYIGGMSALVDGFAEARHLGLIQSVSVSNFDAKKLKEACKMFGGLDVPVAACQFEYNILDRKAETNGVIETCKELDVTPVAYSPLASGLLTGKYTNNLANPARKYTNEQLKFYRQLTNLLKFIGTIERGGGHSTTQVALNYIVSKGVIPIPGVKGAGQANDVVDALKWTLGADSVSVIDEKADYMDRMRKR